MAVRKILQYPDPLLRVRCSEVSLSDPFIREVVRDLRDTLLASPGIGLSAPQIGYPLRVILIDLSRMEERRPILLINPVILTMEAPKVIREGCLSIPQYTANVERMESVRVRGYDEGGKELEITTTGLEAIAIQHEVDHLNGILFIDRVSSLKRDLFRRKGYKGPMPEIKK